MLPLSLDFLEYLYRQNVLEIFHLINEIICRKTHNMRELSSLIHIMRFWGVFSSHFELWSCKKNSGLQ